MGYSEDGHGNYYSYPVTDIVQSKTIDQLRTEFNTFFDELNKMKTGNLIGIATLLLVF